MNRTHIATALSLLSMMSFVQRAVIDWKLVPMFDYLQTPGEIAQFSAYYVAVAGVWGLSLVAASHGSRLGAGLGIAVNLLSATGVGLFTLIWYCPFPCATAPPLMDVVNLANLVLGYAAAAALAVVLVRPEPARSASPAT